MRAFAIGTIIALLLTAGAAYFYTLSNMTMVERSSPAQSVRLGDEASESTQGTGYGAPGSGESKDQPEEEETARR